MALAPEDLVNQALAELGIRERVASLYEGSEAAKAALEVYGQTRDELLNAGEWPLARRANVALTLLKGPPPAGGYNPQTPWTTAYPPPGWLYEYDYPEDCLDLKAVLATPDRMFDLDPRPAVWRVDHDASFDPPKKVVLSNVKDVLAVYVARVTDPALWEPGFTALVIKKLGEKLARLVRDSEAMHRAELTEGTALAGPAEASRG